MLFREAIMPSPNGRSRDHSPLTPAVFHILLALADGSKHGYAIMQEVEVVTGGRSKMGPGTLYGSIKRLLAAGLIAEEQERPDPELDDERRRYYRLTGYGSDALRAEVRRLADLVHLARRKRIQAGKEGH
jgi:DNA-binding PadR family transcriptional regulator